MKLRQGAAVHNYPLKARLSVVEYVNTHLTGKNGKIKEIDIYCVWFMTSLQNWKAMVRRIESDGLYYEVTYNADRNETYIDVYKKIDATVISG